MELNEFLVKAKRATYASEGESNKKVLEDGCKELTYEEGEYRYRDRYYGSNPFGGEEIVWKNDKIIWVMNYYGEITSDIVPEKEVSKFLKKAMREVHKYRPFRGPEVLVEGDFEYNDGSKGDIDMFTGVERILFKNKEIYRLNYHGGSL